MVPLLYPVLLPDKNVASAFISFSEMLEWSQLYFHQKIANCVIRLSNSGFKRGGGGGGKIIKLPYSLSNADVSPTMKICLRLARPKF